MSKLTRLSLFKYSLLALPLAFASLPIYIHAPEFYTSELNISLATIGFILLLLRIFDAVQDPIIGILSDRFYHYRRQIMFFGMILLALGFFLLFHPFIIPNPVFNFALSIILCTTGFSIVSINFQALGGLWNATKNNRTRITTWREAVGLCGLLIASIMPTIFGVNEDAFKAFSLLGISYIPLLLISSLIFFHWFKSANIQKPKTFKQTPFLKRFFGNNWNCQFFSIYFINTFASSIPAVLVIFFINDRLQVSDLTGLFLLLYFLSGALAMPLWQYLSKKFGKKKAWLFSMWLASVTFIWAFSLSSGDGNFYAIICVLSGLALGADLAIPPSIIADQINNRNSQDLASRYFAIMTFLYKTALAFATGITLPILGYLGYQPGNVTDYNITSYLSYAYAFIPCLLKFSVSLWLYRFILKTN